VFEGADRPGGRDYIELVGLRFMGAHGVLPEEEHTQQPFEVDLKVWADLRAAGESDGLRDTVDYCLLCEAVRRVVEGPHVSLIERLAQQVADQVLVAAGGHASRVAVTVRKPEAPLRAELDWVAVHVERP
jgi:dihydroneopterin aldolase/2-amino-4-hydroxy-6-hydroxymethyldihydropteridine diphosphokinase